MDELKNKINTSENQVLLYYNINIHAKTRCLRNPNVGLVDCIVGLLDAMAGSVNYMADMRVLILGGRFPYCRLGGYLIIHLKWKPLGPIGIQH